MGKPFNIDSIASELKARHGLTKFNLSLDRQGHISLDRIEVPKDKRGSGIGSRVLRELGQVADDEGRLIHLGAAGTRLVKFYKRHGFVRNSGRKKDFSLSVSSNMYREPLINKSLSSNIESTSTADDLISNVLLEAESEGEKEGHPLNKPIRTPGERKKFKAYVKNAAGKVVIVRFGDPNMRIKKNIPERRRNFRARHNCATAKDKTTPRYWSCKMW